MKKFSLLAAISILLCSCSNFIQIQKCENFSNVKKNIKKIVCIAPDIALYSDENLNETDFNKTLGIKKFFQKNLKKYSKAGNFEYVVYNPSEKDNIDASFYNNLLPLKTDLLQASLVRENPVNTGGNARGNSITKEVFAAPSHIAPEFSALSKQYGTPYFAWYGIFSAKKKTVCIHLIVDVETSEVVYHEVKHINKRANHQNLPPLIYDSFKMMR